MDRLDHDILLAHVLGVSRTWLHTYPEKIHLTSEQQKTLEILLKRRQQGEPIAYLTGVQEFWSLPLEVNQHTLVPRPETELLVELALHLSSRAAVGAGPSVFADLGTGSGAIAIALSHERPDWTILATDNSPLALATARRNGGGRDITFYMGDWCGALPSGTKCDLILSNPPYIAQNDPHLQQTGVRYEPLTALVSGQDGLDDICKISLQARAYLKPGGWLLLEHGYDQGGRVAEILRTAAYCEVQTFQDLAGLDRVTIGRYL